MSASQLAGLGLLFLLAALPAQAQTPTIDHQPVACAETGKFPKLQAAFAPADAVAKVRVVFQGQTADWYSVAMKQEGVGFVGILPKPNKSLKSFHYYIEVTDKALGTNRTADYTAAVVDSSGACKDKIVAATVASASVLIQGPAGVAAIPAGFASSGVVAGSAAGSSGAAAGAGATAGAGGGGLSATTIGIVGGAVAAGAVVATQVGGGGTTTYSGPYSGTLVNNVIRPNQSNAGCSRNDAHSGTVTVDLDVSSDTVTGDASVQGSSTLVAWIGACAGTPAVGEVQTFGSEFKVSGKTTDFRGSTTVTYAETGANFSYTLAGSLSGDTITGTMTLMIIGPVSLGGSTTFPITLSKH